MNKNKIKKILVLIFVAGSIATVFILRYQKWSPGVTALSEFAKCLRDKGVTMYGASWCPHCLNEKKAFGDSFRFVPYVECRDNPQLCIEKKIQGYPTWIFSDGTRKEGEQGLEKLAQTSGCPLPPQEDKL